jgi:L-alanine-DL-glutamate epimerase-like enolase superfamily enzyme
VLDHAIHDAIGKAFNVPVYKLLGGLCQPRIPLEWSIGMADDPKKIAEEALHALNDFGIRVQCVKAGDRRGWEQDVRNFAAVREAVGPDVMLGVDPNEAWTVDMTIKALRAMEPYNVGYLEQPTPRRDFEGLAEIRRQANGVPLLADESLFTLDDALELTKRRAVDGFCIKLYKVGGLRPARKIAAIAEAAKIRLNAGGVCAFSQLEAAATAHFYASIPEHRMVGAGEFVFGLGTWGPDPLVPQTDFVIKDGHANVPSGPGLGIVVDEAALKKLTLRHEVVK